MRRGHYEREPRLTADLAAAQAFDDAWVQYAAARRLEVDIQSALATWRAEPAGPRKEVLARRVKMLTDCRISKWRRTPVTENVNVDWAFGQCPTGRPLYARIQEEV